ncbi:MAG TPA: hypothetical protein VJZ77_00840 [Blastocatellia bacterium]|nr:hypothetical protein [Blastocatellia bacterium]
MHRPEIHLADLIRALQIMKPDEEARQKIASMLGLEFAAAAPTQLPPSVTPPKQSGRQEQVKRKPRRSKFMGEMMGGLTVELIEESAAVKVPALVLPEPFQESSEENEPSPKFFPLLAPIWTRAIITKMLSVDANDGPPDIPKLIEIISHNRPVKQIPRRPLPTLRQGVQALIDGGQGLVPYLRDQMFFLEQLNQLVGADQVQAWKFIGTPLKYAVSVSPPLLSSYKLPPPGVPLLMLTDLGVAVPPFEVEVATTDEWLAFVRYARQAGYQLLVLTPYHPARYPDTLKNQVRIIQWDRGTSVSTILRALS